MHESLLKNEKRSMRRRAWIRRYRHRCRREILSEGLARRAPLQTPRAPPARVPPVEPLALRGDRLLGL